MTPGLFRLALASIVVVHHLSRLNLGGSAVYVFFVLSGFWIHRMWTEKYAFAERPYETFMVSRLWRLLPVFLIVNAICLIAFYTPEKLLPPYLSHVLIIGYSLLPTQALVPAWSLDIEIQFYALAPLFFIALTWWGRRAWIPMLTLAAIGVVALAAYPSQPFLFHYLLFFGAGIAASALSWRPSPLLAYGALAAASLAVVCVLAIPDLRGILLGGTHRGPLFAFNDAANIALALLVMPFALHTVHQRSNPLDSFAGDLSYCVYLLHWPVSLYVGQHFGQLPVMERLPLVGLAVLATYAFSALLWWAVDRPFNRLRAAYVRRRILTKPAPIAATASGSQIEALT